MSKARDLADLGNAYSDGALSNRNMIINSAMQVAQRGASVTAAGTAAYSSPDRFRFQNNANTNSVISQEADAPVGFNNSFKLTVGTGSTPSGDDFGRLYYMVEGYDADQLKLGSASSSAITLSFWVKTSVTGTYGIQFAGEGAGAFIASYTVAATSTWEYKTVTIPAGVWTTYNGSTTNGTGFQVAFDLGEGPSRSSVTGYNAAGSSGNMGLTGGTKIVATTGATWQITGVQLEVGDTATPFEHRSYGDELARCQRYYYQRDWTAQYQAILVPCWASGANALQGTFYPPVTMRADPTCSHNGVGNFRVNNSLGADQVCNNIIFSAPLKESVMVTFQKATSDLSTTSSGYINTEANNDASMYFDAEL